MMEATRFVFGKEMLEIAKTHDDFVVCNADTKACGIEAMGELFPTRSYSIGIAEQNLINVALVSEEQGAAYLVKGGRISSRLTEDELSNSLAVILELTDFGRGSAVAKGAE